MIHRIVGLVNVLQMMDHGGTHARHILVAVRRRVPPREDDRPSLYRVHMVRLFRNRRIPPCPLAVLRGERRMESGGSRGFLFGHALEADLVSHGTGRPSGEMSDP